MVDRLFGREIPFSLRALILLTREFFTPDLFAVFFAAIFFL